MKRLVLIFLISTVSLYASLVGSNFTQKDIKILEDLDISSSFITDYKLQEVYEQYQSRRNSRHYVSKLNEASLFVPKIKNILKKEGIPDVFIFMAMAESNFTMNAKSSARATGLWQFMSGTGKRYGLENNMYLDERMDLVKSTYAATRYLKSLYSRFDKWYLAAIAYNCGEGRVIEAITRATLDLYVKKYPELEKSKEIKEYRKTIKAYQQRKASFVKLRSIYRKAKTWDVKPDVQDLLREQEGLDRQYLPKESRRYIRKIISLAMMNSEDFIGAEENSHLLNMGISTTISTVNVKGGLHLKNIAKSIGMTYEELHKLNMHIKQSIIPPTKESYTINIPYSRLSTFNENVSTIEDTKFAIHQVVSGDTLYGIARKYKVPYKLIRDYNNLKSTKLSLRQKIVLPIPSDMVGKVKFVEDKSIKRYKKYVVKSGDSLYSIARKHKVDVKQLMQVNKLKNSLLRIGDKIVIR